MLIRSGLDSALVRVVCLTAFMVVAIARGGVAENAKLTVYAEKDLSAEVAGSLASSFATLPLPAQGPLGHPILVDGYDPTPLGEAVAGIRNAYEAGQPVVVVEPTPATQAFLDDLTDGAVDLPDGLAGPLALGAPQLAAFALRRPADAAAADTAEFWVAFDGDDGTPEEEQAEDDTLVASIADWLREESAPVAASAAARRAARPGAGGPRSRDDPAPPGRPAIDDLTDAVARRVTFQFDQGSMTTVIQAWAAHSVAQQEDWYIFELTTTSLPLNFKSYTHPAVGRRHWREGTAYCQGAHRTGCRRPGYATTTQVVVRPRTPHLELMYDGPDSERQQDQYTYNSQWSIGGEASLGFSKKGTTKGVEVTAGAEFSRSHTVTIKDATLVGIGNPAEETAGWRFDMPPLRTVNDLRAHGGPANNCDNLLQMPYPVQRGAMKSEQYAIYRLPASRRGGLETIDLAVTLRLVESVSTLTIGIPTCNIFDCNCTARSWQVRDAVLKEHVVKFPLAALPLPAP